MAAVDIYDAVVELMAANWTSTPVAYENQTQPPAAAESAQGLLPWVLVEIEGRSKRQLSMGAATKPANLWDEQGTIYLHVHVPVGTGSRDARTLADSLSDLFQASEGVDGVQFEDMSIGGGQVGENNGKWWFMTVAVDWRKYQG